MSAVRILVSGAYLDLIKQAMKPGDIKEARDFGKFLEALKWKLKQEGRDELFNQIIREEIHMLEMSDPFV